MTSLMHAASIAWEHAICNSEYRCINHCTQESPIEKWTKSVSGGSFWAFNRVERISSASSRINACFGGCPTIARWVIHSASAFSSGIVRIYWGSRDSAVDLLPSILWSKVVCVMLLARAASRTDWNWPIDSSWRAFSILLSASALFWLLRAGMVVVEVRISGIVKFGGANRDLVQIATGDPSVTGVLRTCTAPFLLLKNRRVA